MNNPLGAKDYMLYQQEFKTLTGLDHKANVTEYLQFVQMKIMQGMLDELQKITKK